MFSQIPRAAFCWRDIYSIPIQRPQDLLHPLDLHSDFTPANLPSSAICRSETNPPTHQRSEFGPSPVFCPVGPLRRAYTIEREAHVDSPKAVRLTGRRNNHAISDADLRRGSGLVQNERSCASGHVQGIWSIHPTDLGERESPGGPSTQA